MRLGFSLTAICLFLRPIMGLGLLQGSPYMQRMQLVAELGLDPDILLSPEKGLLHSALLETAPPKSPIITEYVTMPVDHDNPSAGTYQNRYWVNDEFYKPGRPIVMYDAGETNAEGIAKNHLSSDLSFFKAVLKDLEAIGIIWEHRYYGNSTPYPIHKDTPPEHFKYLTTKQALEDIPYFIRRFSRPKFPQLDLTPNSTPWVLVGGSYAGIRAAFLRNEYPDVIFAAYAASAPVQAQLNMSIYYDQVYRGMIAHGLGNCTKDIRASLGYIDEQLALGGAAATSIKQLFFGPGAENNSNEDFTTALISIYNSFQNYGIGGNKGSLREFCGYLSQDPQTNQSAGADGLAPIYGSEYVTKRWASWPVFTPLVNSLFETNCRGLNTSLPQSCNLQLFFTDMDSISWTWQYCTEWGFYQSNNFGPRSLLSGYQTLEFQQEICNRQFAQAVAKGILPSSPHVQALNDKYGGWTIRPSNTYFSGGEFDPWRTLSHLTTEDIAPEVAPTGVTFSDEIPQCGTCSERTIFGYILKDSEHCFDFRANEEGKKSRELFKQALLKWLPCFQPST
ncbi:serine carboxypeptidase S28-domain-containing protein [Aspergillus avenaceus]|uniref:Serine carboxypeptidase S28-domain-containing protein n=1 Tax=Aspergillus avenaceus TaxID=36643 RepID=A0A5N6U0S8_ASPAV|nr:serine carboxypeptidase S28-domain-containing protein [Aspergillus avenaceus]